MCTKTHIESQNLNPLQHYHTLNWVIIGSSNGMPPSRQAITLIYADSESDSFFQINELENAVC